MFPEGKTLGLYHTADASLWFFHAADRYFRATGDRETLEVLLPKLLDIIDHHQKGTDFGIGVDPADGLLLQGAEGYQLTWMDAKVDDWVVTPRRGKAVEINALWYNALCVTAGWLETESATWTRRNNSRLSLPMFTRTLTRKFWSPNSAIALTLWTKRKEAMTLLFAPTRSSASLCRTRFSPEDKWRPVVNVVHEQLLTPVGLALPRAQ